MEESMQHHPMYIGGRLIAGGEAAEVICPATEKAFATIAWAGPEQADAALFSAEAAFTDWSRTPIAKRTRLMLALRDQVLEHEEVLRETVMLEVGKTWAQTKEDVQSLADSLDFYTAEISRFRPENLPDRAGTHRHQLRPEAVGVVVAFLACNFPLLILCFKLGPALAAVCPFIIKPSP